MKSKSSPNRSVEADIVRLHHATGQQQEELAAKLIYEVLKEMHRPKSSKRKARP